MYNTIAPFSSLSARVDTAVKQSAADQSPRVCLSTPGPSRWTGIILTAIMASIMFSACSRQDDAMQIRSMIKDAAALAAAHDIPGLLDLTSEDVRAMPMDLGRNGIKGMLWRVFNYYGPLTILYPRPQIDIKEETGYASARFPFLIVKTEQTMPDLDKLRDAPEAWIDAIGETADLYRLQLELTRQDGRWRVDHVELERFTGLGFK